jgi:hypothetical protein
MEILGEELGAMSVPALAAALASLPEASSLSLEPGAWSLSLNADQDGKLLCLSCLEVLTCPCNMPLPTLEYEGSLVGLPESCCH